MNSGLTGTQFQLASKGQEDLFIETIPMQDTFYHKPTRPPPSATVHQTITGVLVRRKTQVLDVPLAGDVLVGGTMEMDIPSLNVPGTHPNKLGYRLFDRIKLVVNDVVVSDVESLWYDISTSQDLLQLDPGNGLTTDETHLIHVPLRLGISLRAPLVLSRLFRAKVQLHIQCGDWPGVSADLTKINIHVFLDYMSFDDATRRRLPKAVAYTIPRDASEGTSSIDLSRINSPVSKLVFVGFSGNAVFDYASLPEVRLTFGPDDVVGPRKFGFYALQKPFTDRTAPRITPNANVGVIPFDEYFTIEDGVVPSTVDFAKKVKNPKLKCGFATIPNQPKIKVFAETFQILDTDGTARTLFIS